MSCITCNSLDRRTFLKFAAGTAAGMMLAPRLLLADGTAARARAKSVILLWMGGGPSQLDTWDPKPGRKNGGEFKAIDTSARGMRISEHLPRIAEQGKHLSILRALTTEEAAHERGTYLMHTGYGPIAGLPFAPVGTVASREISNADFPLPSYVALQPPPIPLSPIWGDRHLPFTVQDIDNPIPNLRAPVEQDRNSRREALLKDQDKGFEAGHTAREVERRQEAAKKARDLMTTPLLRAFDVSKEPEKWRREYGENPGKPDATDHFGRMCLLARRLVEAGVTTVEIGLGGWDTHQNNFEAVKNLSRSLDVGMGTLIKDLAEKGLLKETLVLWAGEFGRTPEINTTKGRDHWTKCWSVVMAGGGIQGGRVIGETDKDGMDVHNRPVPVQDYFATVYHCLGIDPEKQYVLSSRKVKYAFNGKMVKELF